MLASLSLRVWGPTYIPSMISQYWDVRKAHTFRQSFHDRKQFPRPDLSNDRQFSVSSPLILVDRDNLRRDGIDGNSVSSQLPDRCFHVSVFILSAYAVLSSFGSYAGHIIFRRIGNWFSTQPDTQFTSCMQRNRLIIQLISKKQRHHYPPSPDN